MTSKLPEFLRNPYEAFNNRQYIAADDIALAYDIPSGSAGQHISGLPGWATTERFDVEAAASEPLKVLVIDHVERLQ